MGYVIGADGNPSVSSLVGTEIFVCRQTTVKDCTSSIIAGYVIDELLGSDAADPTTGDNLVAERDGTEKLMDLDDLAAYCVASGWGVATEADPGTAADKFLVNRSGTVYELDIDTVATYILTGMQGDALDISGLDEATLTQADQYLIVQGSTAKKTTWEDIADRAHDQFSTYLGTLGAASSVGSADKLYTTQLGTAKYVTPSRIATYVQSAISSDVTETIFDSDAVDPLLGTDVLPAERSGTAKTATGAVVAAYAVTTLGDADAVDPATTGDDIVLFRSDTEKLMDIDVLSSYVGTQELATASGTPLTSFAESDLVVLGRANALRTMDYEDFRSGILNISGLSTATLADSDKYLIVQGTTAKINTFANVAERVHDQFSTYLGTLSPTTSLSDADKIYTTHLGTAKYVTASRIATYVESAISSDVISTAMDSAAVNPTLGTDILIVERSGVQKTATGAVLAAYAVSALDDASAVDPVAAGDDFILFRSGTEQKADIDVLAAYIGDKVAATESASLVDPVVGTDAVMLARSDAMIATDVDTLSDYALTQDGEGSVLQTSVLTIDALGAATLADANYLLLQDGTPKQKTLGDVADHINDKIAAYVGDQSDADPIVDTDLFLVDRVDTAMYIGASDLSNYVQSRVWDQTTDTDPVAGDQMLSYRSGTGYLKTTMSDLKDYVVDDLEAAALTSVASGWNIVGTDDYTATPSSTSRILISDTTNMEVGLPLRYTYDGTAYYGIVEEVSTNSYIDVRGATLDTGEDLTELAHGLPSLAETVRLQIEGSYLVPWYIPDSDADADGVGDSEVTEELLADISRRYFNWRGGPAHLVAMAVTQRTADDTAQPKFGVQVDSVDVFSEDTNKGPQISATSGTWAWNSKVAVATGAYKIETGDDLEIICTANGSSGEASDVSVELVFVYE